ncbi:IgGFc-binding protein-like [Seriola lalandi dorsalis]|uniref:IgGFc-binding protein-like n=1 Tax=Seriola lalandi dorsalis TaxID=1841481 RepID=UPI000C6FACA8|nr:IgGFc-binding protein-like [Seriola lalandi dorsalis]XP_023252304.1 IgGFc-binding protein-like [Seriola lalandi dorsalis]
MCPGPLLVLLLAALSSGSSPPENNTGLSFIVVFPENIAYYYPATPQNKVQITALHDNTRITFKQHTFDLTNADMNAGESKEFDLDARLELRMPLISEKTLVITSSNRITVQAISQKSNSLQTALVIPTEKLGTEYLIPPIPSIQGTTDQVTVNVTERNPFKLIIVSADQDTKVTVTGARTQKVSLKPQQISSIWVHERDELRAVTADQPVAVLFAHPCANRQNCTCGLLYNMLPPARNQKLKFYIPPFLATGAVAETFLLLSKEKPYNVAFDPDSPLVKTSGTAILYRPGLLLALVPEEDFASCFVVNHIPDTKGFAVIVVHKDFTDGVQIGDLPLKNPAWQKLKGTEFVSTELKLALPQNFIWHKSSNMAVYFVGHTESGLFGNPAPIISTSPDPRGCTLTPEVVELGNEALGWRESLQYCRDKNLELVSLSNATLWAQIHKKIVQANSDNVRDVWIGMRRSSLTGEWYWLNKDPVTDTNWEKGEPGNADDGQCAIMSLKKDFGWSDKDCCKTARPLCYSKPVLLPPPPPPPPPRFPN